MAWNSSLELLIEINQSEREAQLSHFNSLDTKSGLVLGFAGVLIALGNGTGTAAGTASIALAALAALTAVSSFWPRRFPTVDPTRLGDYAVSQLRFTQLTVLDTFEVMLIETSQRLETKSRRLKWAASEPECRCGAGCGGPGARIRKNYG
jgi:hypothetical protein